MARVGLLTLVLAASWFRTSLAQTGIPTLRGVTKVTTIVDANLNQCRGDQVGLTDDRLRTIVELRLRTAGLRVLTAEEDRADPNVNPYVRLSIICLPTVLASGNSTGFVFATSVSVLIYQRVSLNSSLAPSQLWENEYLNISSKENLSGEVEKVVGQLMDELINEWLSANPKQ